MGFTTKVPQTDVGDNLRPDKRVPLAHIMDSLRQLSFVRLSREF